MIDNFFPSIALRIFVSSSLPGLSPRVRRHLSKDGETGSSRKEAACLSPITPDPEPEPQLRTVIIQSPGHHHRHHLDRLTPLSAVAVASASPPPRSLPITTPVTIAISSDSRCNSSLVSVTQPQANDSHQPYLIIVPNHNNPPPNYDSDEASDMEIPPTPNSVGVASSHPFLSPAL